ncbi:MAG: hypothetical protein AAGG56_17310 [Pseudomonadota bacterium]
MAPHHGRLDVGRGGAKTGRLKGADAGRLAQTLSARDLSKQSIGQGKYVSICDHRGRLLNDPILSELAEDRYWLSMSDSDIWTSARAVAGERGLDVDVSEPDASPLAIQRPKAEGVVASLFGGYTLVSIEVAAGDAVCVEGRTVH